MPKVIYTKEKVLKEFLNLSINKNEIFHLYINSPFCVNQCSYCKHKGAFIKENAKEYREYFESYLPGLIEFYSPVLEKNTPSAVYFGGGSSSIMTAKDMKNIFNKIPNFIKIPDKTFECDINLLTDEKINLLIDYKFTKISFGVQSFNENILRKNNRPIQDINKIKETVQLFQKHNMLVNCDLMTLIDNENESDFKQLILDMKKMTNIVKPNQICIYPNTYVIDKLIKDDKEKAIKLIKNLKQNILKNIPSFNNYNLGEAITYTFKNRNIEEYLRMDYEFYRTYDDEKKYLNSYNASPYPNNLEKYSLLGIGAFKKNKSTSYIRKDFYFFENNENNDYKKTYYTTIIK